jgi:dihydroorotase
MNPRYHLIKNGTIVNEGESFKADILIKGELIEKILLNGATPGISHQYSTTDATGCIVIPGLIDDQVHFREPGATYKADIQSESAAAVLGGVTSYMDMPNNNPPATTFEQLESKYHIASKNSFANYSFYLGATNDNIEEIQRINLREICGLKVFMGSSTGNMLVDNKESLDKIFEKSPSLIATHCESENIIHKNTERAKQKYGEEIPFFEHANIRSREACIESTQEAIFLAQKHKSRLHILHISTKEEIELIRAARQNNPDITAEACVHYMIFNDTMYEEYGSKIKCNPSIKNKEDQIAIRNAVKDGIIKVVATDHAPHTIDDKNNKYLKAPSGLPLVQHSLQLMLELHKQGVFTIEEVVDRMAHSPANCFKVKRRGFIREGYYADISVVDLSAKQTVSSSNIVYKCKWSPFEGKEFNSRVIHTFVNGTQVVANGTLTGIKAGKRITFSI